MSDNNVAMPDSIFDLQIKLIDTKLGGIAKSQDDLGTYIKKILDDHELRLRDQAKTDAANAQDIIALRMEVKDLRQEVLNFKNETIKQLDCLADDKEKRTQKELSLWQTLTFELLKIVLVGASGGGVLFGLFKLFGINL